MLLAAGVLITTSLPVAAGDLGMAALDDDDRAAERDFYGNDLTGKDGPLAKVGMDLVRLYREHQSFVQSQVSGAFISANPLARVSQSAAGVDLVVIDATADGDAKALRAALEAMGMQDGADYGRMVSGRLPIDAVPAMAALPDVRLARPAMAMTNVGSTTSQGDISLGSNVARTQFGFTGAGVRVGTLSDSYNCLGGEAGDVASGDLPGGVLVLQDFCPPGTPGSDEGRAMMQLIRDIAPDATQSFHTAFLGQADFASGIGELAAPPSNARVIVDDVINLFEPMFQDGIIAQAVDNVVAAGNSYFSSSGNQARFSYQSAFRTSAGTGPGGGPLHDFDPGPGVDSLQSVTIPVGARISFTFQWDQPFFSVSGAPGSANDIDIFLVNEAGTVAIAGSNDRNVGGDPVEVFGFINAGPGTAFQLAIERFSGASPGLMKYVFFGAMTVNEFDTRSPSSFGHANATGAEAVGAAFYVETPQCGTNPPLLEDFSSAGGTPILFNTAGVRLGAPDIRQKPEIVAPDGTNTTFFGQAIADPVGPCSSTEPFPNFFGTSAAAPHAAAVAALMRGANPAITPAMIDSNLKTTAIDMGPAGFDFDSGFGLIEATAAVQASIVCNGLTPTLIGTAGSDTITGTAGNDVIAGLGGDDTINGLGGIDTICGGEGNDTMLGGVGNDLLIGELGDDTFNGGRGLDTAGFGGGAAVNANLTTGAATGQGSDTLTAMEALTGSRFADTLTGNAKANRLNGGDGDDRLRGRAGNDLLIGELGNDTFNGGPGSDTASFAGGAAVNASLTTRTATGQGSDTLTAMETLIGSSFADTLTGNAGSNRINGGDGDDTLRGRDGNDNLRGGPGDDAMNGGVGVDTCNGGTGVDNATACETIIGVP